MAEVHGLSELDRSSDELLAERAADGDVRAFAVLIRRHGPALRGYAARLLGGTDESDDVVQETFITAWARLPELADPSAVRGWLFRIAGRKAVDLIRLRKPRADDDAAERPDSETRSPSSSAEASSLGAALSVALDALPDQQRRAWLLREYAGLDYAEIADELEVPQSTVRGLLARARKQLAIRMEAWR